MTSKVEKPKEQIDIREPTKAQKRQIMSMLDEVYDADQERYRKGDTDDAVADVLGVMPGWVAEIREEFFGPDGGNENIDELLSEFEKWRNMVETEVRAVAEVKIKLMKAVEQVNSMSQSLQKIKTAVGPRNIRKAGIR